MKIDINKVDFGDYDAKDDFAKKDLNEIKGIFFHTNGFELNDFIDKKKSYIYGHKGTGKTAALYYIERVLQSKTKKCRLLLFKELKNQDGFFEELIDIFKNVEIIYHDIYFQKFWRWTIYSYLYEMLAQNKPSVNSIFNTNKNIFSKLSKILQKTNISASLSLSNTNIEANGQISTTSNQAGQHDYDIKDITKKISSLETEILSYFANSNSDMIYILCDELELFLSSNTIEIESSLIKSLITVVGDINSKFDFIQIILCIRSEILANEYMAGEELNKIIKGKKGLEVKWKSSDFNSSHPLLQMIIKKVRYSYSEVEINLNNKSDKEIFVSLFDGRLSQENKTSEDDARFILNSTWLRPRGIIMLFNEMQKNLNSNNLFDVNSYKEAVINYSSAVWEEIREELTAQYTIEEIKNLETVLSFFKKNFTFSEFQDKVHSDWSNKSKNETEILLKSLYFIGVVGNNFIEKGNDIYRFHYRDDRNLNIEKPMILHRALWNYFSLEDNNSVKYNDYSYMNPAYAKKS